MHLCGTTCSSWQKFLHRESRCSEGIYQSISIPLASGGHKQSPDRKSVMGNANIIQLPQTQIHKPSFTSSTNANPQSLHHRRTGGNFFRGARDICPNFHPWREFFEGYHNHYWKTCPSRERCGISFKVNSDVRPLYEYYYAFIFHIWHNYSILFMAWQCLLGVLLITKY